MPVHPPRVPPPGYGPDDDYCPSPDDAPDEADPGPIQEPAREPAPSPVIDPSDLPTENDPGDPVV